MKEIIANENDSDQRLDKFIAKYLKSMPKNLIYKYIRKRRIKVNNKKTTIDYKVHDGDKIQLYINDEFFENAAKQTKSLKATLKNVEKKKLHIIYEDNNIILVNKESGTLIHSDKSESTNTLVNMVKKHLLTKGEYDPSNEKSFSPSPCNRLDRNTEGIVIFAKNAHALRFINNLIRDNNIEKTYLCLVHGIPKKKSDVLENYCLKNKKKNTLQIIKNKHSNAKIITTEYKVIGPKNDLSLLKVKLITGRSHQIRAHLSYIGHPIVGDKKYGGQNVLDVPYNNYALQSFSIKFVFDEERFSYLNNKEFSVPYAKFVEYITD